MAFKSFFHPGRVIERFPEFLYFTQLPYESLCEIIEEIHLREMQIDEVRDQMRAKQAVLEGMLARTDLPRDPQLAARITENGHRLWYRALVALCCKLSDPRMFTDIVTVEGRERFDEVLARWGACVLVTPHYGPHLALPFLLVKLGMQLQFSGFISNEYVEACKSLARFHGLDAGVSDGLVVNDGFAMAAIGALSSGRSLCIYPEYSQSKRLGEHVTTFLGRTVHTPTGPARLAGAAKRPILTCVLRPLANYRHRLCFETIIPPEELASDEGVAAASKQIFAEVEVHVREYPEAWEGWHYFETMETNGALVGTRRMFAR